MIRAMRLFVLGATGRTGRSLVAQALSRGHAVTAFGRSAPQIEMSKNFRAVIGNPMRPDEFAEALAGHDAVLSALGARGLGVTSVLLDSARASIEAMQRVGMRRLIVISSSLVDSRAGWIALIAARTLLRHIANDQRAMETLLTQTDLDWTILRPGLLSNGMVTGRYTVTPVSAGIPTSRAVSRQDLAHMLLDTVERGAYIKEIVWLHGGAG